jgi:hypothetical protein
VSRAQPAAPARASASQKKPAIVLVASCISLACNSAHATNYELNPRVELAGGYNDNVTLVSGPNAISAPDALAAGRVEWLAQQPNWEWRVTPEVSGNWYSGHSELNSNAEFLHLEGERRGPRYTLDLYGFGASQSLITNYLPTANLGTGLGTSQPGTTLATPASVRQNLGYVRPSYQLEMTPRASLGLDLEYTNAGYSEQTQGYTDYWYLAGAAALGLKATPTGSATLRATGSRFQPETGLKADTYGAELQWDGRFSATKRYYLRVGGARTDLSGSLAGGPAVSSSRTTPTGGIGAQWTYTLTEIFIDLTRDVEPTGTGYSVDRDQLRLRVARRFTPRLAGFLGARAIHDDPLPGSVAPTVEAQRYLYGTVGFEWRFERQFSLIGAYNFTDYHFGGSSAEANAARLSLVYEPHRPENGPAITIGY